MLLNLMIKSSFFVGVAALFNEDFITQINNTKLNKTTIPTAVLLISRCCKAVNTLSKKVTISPNLQNNRYTNVMRPIKTKEIIIGSSLKISFNAFRNFILSNYTCIL